jgi:type VI secretion system secreted protein Hcp
MKRTVSVLSVIFMALLILSPVLLMKTHAQVPPTAAVQTGRNSFYVIVKGAKQGQFKAEAGNPAAGQIPGIKFSMQLATITNPATGLSTGRRQYSPITFTKLWGPASAQFLQAASVNENLTAVTFDFVSVGLDGKAVITQSITLTNATVSSIKRYINVPIGNESADPRELEDITFTFQKLEFRDAANASFTDSWSAAL